MLKGDANTHFFYQYASGRRRKITILHLEANCEEIRGQHNIIKHVVDFYKELFVHSSDTLLNTGDNF